MALQKTNVSLNLGNGMDQKSDNKVGSDNQYADMKDWIYKKIGKIYKRFGTNKYSATVSTTYPNPLTIGTSTIPSSTFAYKDQLLMQNKGALYSWFENQSLWGFKGHHYPLEVSNKVAVASELQYDTPTSYYVGGLRVIFYRAHDTVTVSTLGSTLKYTVIENSTGNILVDDVTITSFLLSTNVVIFWQVVSFASRSYFIYNDNANMNIAEINLTTGVLGVFSILKSDMQINAGFSPADNNWPFDVVLTNKTGVGERAFITYYNTSNQISIFALTNTGIVDPTIGTYIQTYPVRHGFATEYNPVTDLLYIIYQTPTFTVEVKNYTFTSSSIVLSNTITVIGSFAQATALDLKRSPVDTSQILIMYNIHSTGAYSVGFGSEPYLYEAVVNQTTLVTAPILYGTGYIIAARSYYDTLRTTVYSFVQNTIGNQKTYFMIDRIKGKTENALFVQAKWNYGLSHYVESIRSIPQVSLINSSLYLALPKIIDLVGNPVNGVPASVPILTEKIGIEEAFINLTPELSASTTFLGDAVHTSGGYLGYYDGSNHVESSYFLDPELVIAEVNVNTTARILATINVQGVNGAAEISKVAFGDGSVVFGGPTYYWAFYVVGADYIVWYNRNGIGTAPTISGIKIQVTILSSDTAIQIRDKTKAAIVASSAPVSMFDSFIGISPGVTITNNVSGSVNDILDNMGGGIAKSILTQGVTAVRENTDFTLSNGSQQLSGPTYYWTFTTIFTTYVVWYIIDGVGTIPAAAGTKISVNISFYDSTSTVISKTLSAFAPFITTFTATYIGTNKINITNVSAGAVTDADVSHYSLAPSIGTGLDAGTYQYCAIWNYFDVNGQSIKSAPSIPVSVTVTANQTVSLTLWCPLLTNRNVQSIRIEWYRTKANLTTFYKITGLSEDRLWALGTSSVGYYDSKKDSNITASPELLYTNGGILDNYQIPTVKHVSVFKNRIIASGVDDPTAFYYSKTAISGAPVEFAAEMFIQVDIDSDSITGHSQLDDKLIIFKKTKIYYLAGDGANDLGQGSSFSLPTLVATDVGCTSHNSIVKTPLGLMFKSQKGIYLLDRALQLSYIGKEVEDYNSTQVMGAKLLAEDNQVRFTLKTGFTLVYDYLFNRWTSFSQYGGDGATIWKDKFARVDNSGRIYVEDKSIWIDNGSTVTSYSPTIMTKWLQVKDLQNYSRIYRLAILGDLKSAHILNYKLYYDYDVTNYDEYNFDSTIISGTGYDDTVYQPIIHLKRQKCDAMMVVITVIPGTGTQECLELVDMSFTVGLKEGLQKVKASKKL